MSQAIHIEKGDPCESPFVDWSVLTLSQDWGGEAREPRPEADACSRPWGG